ncbi:hypothetical protein JCM33774_18620 [Actinophytocola sp. KF-1]
MSPPGPRLTSTGSPDARITLPTANCSTATSTDMRGSAHARTRSTVAFTGPITAHARTRGRPHKDGAEGPPK